jgi:hypothetical protein
MKNIIRAQSANRSTAGLTNGLLEEVASLEHTAGGTMRVAAL